MAFSEGPDLRRQEAAPVVRQRISLGRTRRRFSFERRVRTVACGRGTSLFCNAGVGVQAGTAVHGEAMLVLGLCVAAWALASSYFFDSIVRPMQTLSNIVAALRENDFSFRARGARRGDAMGDLALEINALASTLQQQRSSALDALALADRVMTSMQSPVVAFDEGSNLRLMNAAAERAFGVQRGQALRRTAAEIGLLSLLRQKDESLYAHSDESQPQWSVRRAGFRLYGVPHTLFVLSDVAAALQEEERVAWQRLIRVLGHEINNSLTPIKSIASMLRARPLHLDRAHHTSQDLNDMRRGLSLIEDRADSLNRFLQAYQQMSRLPPPSMRPMQLVRLGGAHGAAGAAVAVRVLPGEDVRMMADPDQLQQLLINLMKNAAEAALDPEAMNEAAKGDAAVGGAGTTAHDSDCGQRAWAGEPGEPVCAVLYDEAGWSGHWADVVAADCGGTPGSIEPAQPFGRLGVRGGDRSAA